MGSTWVCLRSSARLCAPATSAFASGAYFSRWIVCSGISADASLNKESMSDVRRDVNVTVYVTNYCPYCTRAKRLLENRGIPYEEIDVTGDDEKRAWLVRETGRRTVPQIFIKGEPIGGSDDLYELDRSGELAKKLAPA